MSVWAANKRKNNSILFFVQEEPAGAFWESGWNWSLFPVPTPWFEKTWGRVKVPHQTVCHISFIQHWLKFWQTSHYSMWIITASLQHDSRSRTCNVSVVILKHCWRALAVASLVLSNDQANPGLSLSSRLPCLHCGWTLQQQSFTMRLTSTIF